MRPEASARCGLGQVPHGLGKRPMRPQQAHCQQLGMRPSHFATHKPTPTSNQQARSVLLASPPRSFSPPAWLSRVWIVKQHLNVITIPVFQVKTSGWRCTLRLKSSGCVSMPHWVSSSPCNYQSHGCTLHLERHRYHRWGACPFFSPSVHIFSSISQHNMDMGEVTGDWCHCEFGCSSSQTRI